VSKKTTPSLIVLSLTLLAVAAEARDPGLARYTARLQTAAKRLASKPPPNPASMVHDKWAVVVGIDRFQDPSIAPEQSAARNAVELVKALRDPETGKFPADHVLPLTGSRATKQAILDALTGSWLIKKALPHDLIFVYLSTSTIVAPDGKDVYLCAYDTLGSEAELSGISLRQLLGELRHRIQSRYIVCALDAAAQPSRAESVPSPAALAGATGVSLLAASRLDRPSLACPEAGSSCFTHYLCQLLGETMGYMPLRMVSERLARHLSDEAGKTGQPAPEPALALAADAPDLAGIPLGVPVKSGAAGRKLSIGHPVDDLPLSRPDLARPRQMAARSEADAEEEEEENDEEAVNGVSFGSYMAKMKQQIQMQWHPPKGFENRHVTSVFTIMRDGTIKDAQIVEGSGVEAVDRSALEALRAASPLAPLPLGAPRSVQIRYHFDWRVSHN